MASLSQGYNQRGKVGLARGSDSAGQRRYFALPSRRRTVGVIGDAFYVATALSPKGGGGFKPVRIEEGAVNRENLARLDILIADNVTRFSPLEIDAIAVIEPK